jgi:hypothetical protein
MKSSAKATPSASAIRCTTSTPTSPAARSIRETVGREIPARSASCSCERCALARATMILTRSVSSAGARARVVRAAMRLLPYLEARGARIAVRGFRCPITPGFRPSDLTVKCIIRDSINEKRPSLSLRDRRIRERVLHFYAVCV